MKHLLPLIILLISITAFGQKTTSGWSDTKHQIQPSLEADRHLHPIKFRTLILDKEQMMDALDLATPTAAVDILLPMPNGEMTSFSVVETMVMPRVLANKFPGIKTYTGFNGQSIVKLDVTLEGFHAMILGEKGQTVFIDPYAKGNTDFYISYLRSDYRRLNNIPFECGVEEVANDQYVDPIFNGRMAGDCQLRTYTLALACTGEYAAFHGGTVAGALSAMNTSLNRINGVYERELGITLELVSNNEDVIFLNANTDPYTNNNGGAMLNQNQTTCDANIGIANYDIGHVFSTGGGGIAQLNSPCTGGRARGVTGAGSPVGDPFDIDYVAHEMGHQFGGNHTQNNSCNNAGPAGVEPGSASTIMGYAGICNPNVQNNSDDYYSAYSINEMTNYMVFGNGNNCSTTSSNGNNAPVISVTQTSYTIPNSTPFRLTASGTDQDGDNLTYCWEQMDATQATMPPVGTSNSGPLFRSLDPTTSPTRYFLNLDALFNGSDPTWEELPEVGRDMSFRCTLRDNHMGLGCTDEADVSVTSTNNGPFNVITASAPTAWVGASMETVTWDLGGSDSAPVNCNNVDILLWEEGGAVDPIVIMNGVPNNGSATITVPNITGNNYRLLIQASDNIFFDISDANISIEAQLEPSYTVSGLDDNYSACVGDTITVSYIINSIAGFDASVETYISLNDNDVEVIGLPNMVEPGVHSFMLIPTANTPSNMFLVFHTSYNGTPTSSGFNVTYVDEPITPTQEMPLDGTTGVGNSTQLSWIVANTSGNASILVDTNPNFLNATSYSSGSSTKTITGLVGSTVYYWKVRGQNGCGWSDFSPVFAFQTGGSGCEEYTSSPGLPITDGTPTTHSFSVSESFEVATATLDIDIEHTYVGDVSCTLERGGTVYDIFDRPGNPESNFGCSQNDIFATFDDVNGAPYDDFEATCEESSPAISGLFQSMNNGLSGLVGGTADGVYTLTVTDAFNQDDGVLNSYTLTLCYDEVVANQLVLVNNNVLNYSAGALTVLPNTQLLSTEVDLTAGDVTYILLRLPSFGNITLNNVALAIGDTYTQLDVENGNISYESIDIDATSDDMLLDVYSTTNSWLHNVEFVFEVGGAAVLNMSIEGQTNLGCFEDGTGSVTLGASNGMPPYMYSMDGTNYQDDPTFNNLFAGTITFYVQDAAGTIVSTNVVLTQPTEILISAVVVNGDIVANATGGVGEIDFQLNGDIVNGETTNISATDSNGCSSDLDFLIHIIEPTLAVSNPDCFMDEFEGGSVTLNPTEGVEPYSYSLDGEGFVDTNTFDNLTEGTHTVSVMDSEGNMTTASFDIVNPELLEASADVEDFTVTVTPSGGTAPYTYSSNGVDFVDSNEFTLEDGVYSITTMDNNGCTVVNEIIVSDIDDVTVFENNLQLFPNPNTGLFDITFGALKEELNVSIYNTIGQLIYSKKVDSKNMDRTSINLDVADGVYQVVIQNAHLTYTEKVVVIR